MANVSAVMKGVDCHARQTVYGCGTLKGMNDELQLMIEMLRTTRRPSMRLGLARQLAELRAPEAAPVLLDLIEESADPLSVSLVTAALDGLLALGPVIAPLVEAILDDETDPRRKFMPLLLANARGNDALPRLVAALDDPDLEVQVNAATQLGQLSPAGAYAPLLAVLNDRARPAALRGAAASALGSLKDSRALPVLAALSRSNDPELLAGAIDGLAELRDPAGIPYLEALLERPGLDERTNRAIRLGLLAMERYRPL
jgi:HEAT repeat protein